MILQFLCEELHNFKCSYYFIVVSGYQQFGGYFCPSLKICVETHKPMTTIAPIIIIITSNTQKYDQLEKIIVQIYSRAREIYLL